MKTHVRVKTCAQMFTATLFATVKKWPKPACPSGDEWISRTWRYPHDTTLCGHKSEWHTDTFRNVSEP